MTPCPWWRAWAHRRRRRRDREAMWTVLRRNAGVRHPDDEEAAALDALTAWGIFITEAGQEHWRCACAAEDEVSARRTD